MRNVLSSLVQAIWFILLSAFCWTSPITASIEAWFIACIDVSLPLIGEGLTPVKPPLTR
jgi:hypothetical protein